MIIVEQILLQKRPRNRSKWSTEYHICYYVSNCSSWSVVFKSSVCHLDNVLCILNPNIMHIMKIGHAFSFPWGISITGGRLGRHLEYLSYAKCIVQDINRLLLQ